MLKFSVYYRISEERIEQTFFLSFSKMWTTFKDQEYLL